MDDTEIINSRDYPPRGFYDSPRGLPRPAVRRLTRQAASDVDFRQDLVRISEGERRKRRAKPQQCPSCLSQPVHNNSADSRPNDHHRHKNPEKLEASLTQHLDYEATRMPGSRGRDRVVHPDVPSSARTITAHQRSQYHRPGTSRNRSNPGNTTTVRRRSRKRGSIGPRGRTGLDSPRRDIVNSDEATEEHDFRFPRDLLSRNICKESELRWHSPSGEPQSEPEMDSPPANRRRDCPESKKRHAGQGECVYGTCRELEAKVSIETGSSVDKDVREQCERDQQELKDLFQDVGEFAKRKSAGWIADESNDEDYTWERAKHQPDEKDEETDLLESINHFVGKLSVQRKENTKASTSTKTRSKSRARGGSQLAYHSAGPDGRIGQLQEVPRNLDDELADVHPSTSKGRQEENEDLSETEEEARELAREETETEGVHRRRKSWALIKRHSGCLHNSQSSGKANGATRNSTEDKEEKIPANPDCRKTRVDTRESLKGRRDKEAAIYEESEALRPNRLAGNEAERGDGARTNNARVRNAGRDGTADKMYREFARRYGASGDLELETSKTKTCIDEMIDSGLSREAKRGNAPRETSEDLRHTAGGPGGSPRKRGASEQPSKIIRPDSSCPVLRGDERSRAAASASAATRGDCFCKSLAEIVADSLDPREYLRKLKDRRWAYLNSVRSDLEKLYGLEKYLDSCSPERRSSSATLRGFPPESKDPKSRPTSRSDVKESATKMRL